MTQPHDVIFVTADDWIGMYLDGNLLDQNHSLFAVYVVQDLAFKCVGSVSRIEVKTEWLEGGHLPEKYEDIPEEAFVD